MRRAVCAWVLLLLPLCAHAAAPAAASPPAPAAPSPSASSSPAASPSAKELLRDALELWQTRQDYAGARVAFDRAVDAAPADTEIRFARAMFFETASSQGAEDERARFVAQAKEDYHFVARTSPDSRLGAAARDRLALLDDRRLFAGTDPACPAEAERAYRRAESLFGDSRFDEALTDFAAATTACPQAATYWIGYADAYFARGDYAQARELFRRALSADPWNREAHRYLADTESALGNRQDAARESALAVLSDPTSQAAWETLRDHSVGRSTAWNRVLPEAAGVARTDREGVAWRRYQAACRAEENESAFAAQRRAVRSALETWRRLGGRDLDAPRTFWEMMSRAESAGYLDEAIFLHLMDAPLVADYLPYRDRQRTRLVAYIETLIAPPTLGTPAS